MPYLNEPFDTANAPDNEMPADFEPIPAGIYLMEIINSDIKDTKRGDGQYIEFEFTLIDNKYANRRIWTRINIVNRNPKAVEIGKGQLKDLCTACGRAKISQTEELHGIPIKGQVKVVPPKGAYPASNDIRRFMPAGGNMSMNQQSQESQPSQAPSDSPPW